MDSTTYLILHLIGLSALTIGTGGMLAGDKDRRTFAIVQGVGLLIILVSGFGMLAKMQLGFPHFAMVKIVLWLGIGMLPIVFRKMGTPALIAILIFLALIGFAAWLGVMKPALW